MIGESLIGEAIQGARLRIGLELAVPRLGVELRVPTPELRQLLARQSGDIALKFLDLGHDLKLAEVGIGCITPIT